MGDDITMVIPSIPPRGQMLARLISTIGCQTLPPEAISVAIDIGREGAGPTRTRALEAAQTEWVAFVDDDDTLLPHHLETLMGAAIATNSDVVWPWFEVIAGTDPFPELRGRQWDAQDPHMFPITTLVRTELAKEVGFTAPVHEDISGEDHPFFAALSDAGGFFFHVDEITWQWWHNTGNTSGLPSRW